MAEWLKALVLKINVSKDTVSSNLTLPGALMPFYILINMFNFYKDRDLLRKQNDKQFYKSNDLDSNASLLNKKKIDSTEVLEGFNLSLVNKVDSNFIIVIKSSLRGFHISISTDYGQVLKVYSAGLLGYKKAQRYNQESLNSLAREVLDFFQPLKKKDYTVSIVLKGFNSKRKRLVKLFVNSFLKKRFISLIDMTDLPYNGCRPKKLRRK